MLDDSSVVHQNDDSACENVFVPMEVEDDAVEQSVVSSSSLTVVAVTEENISSEQMAQNSSESSNEVANDISALTQNESVENVTQFAKGDTGDDKNVNGKDNVTSNLNGEIEGNNAIEIAAEHIEMEAMETENGSKNENAENSESSEHMILTDTAKSTSKADADSSKQNENTDYVDQTEEVESIDQSEEVDFSSQNEKADSGDQNEDADSGNQNEEAEKEQSSVSTNDDIFTNSLRQSPSSIVLPIIGESSSNQGEHSKYFSVI